LLLSRSRIYILQGVQLQDPSGFNPEKGGYDCSYHSVGLVYAERYYDIVATEEEKKILSRMLQKGIDWLTTRVNPDGTLNAEGNTRTGLGQETGRNNNIKTLNYGQAFRALYRWGQQSGNTVYGDWATKVISGQKLDRK
jgi:hypothetical protein